MTSILDDWHTAPIDEKLRSMLGFLEKVTLSPDEVSAEDIVPLRTAGLSDQAIEEALYVMFLFNLMDRLADAFDFHIPTKKGQKRTANMLYRLGYGAASVPG